MKTEIELFEKWFIKTEAYKLISEMNYFKMDLFYFIEGRGEYRHSSVQIVFMVWTEFAKREGFVLVPVEPTERMRSAAEDMVTFGGGYDVIYSAMIEAANENQD